MHVSAVFASSLALPWLQCFSLNQRQWSRDFRSWSASIWFCWCSFWHTGIQLFRERLSEKKGTRQSRKVLSAALSSLFFKAIWKNGKTGHGRMFAVLKESSKSRSDSYSVRNNRVLIISHIRIFARACFSENLSRNKCIISHIQSALASLLSQSSWLNVCHCQTRYQF